MKSYNFHIIYDKILINYSFVFCFFMLKRYKMIIIDYFNIYIKYYIYGKSQKSEKIGI